MRNFFAHATIALLIFGVAPFAYGQQSSEAADPPHAAKGAVAVSSIAAPPDYRIGVSDVIDISVWKDADLSRTVPVRPDGKISLPLIGDVEASGKTTDELRDLIVARLKPYVPDAEVTVIVEQINSRKYFVLGQVLHPGSYTLVSPTTVVEALAAAGGFADWAQTGKIMVVRHTADHRIERIRFSYKHWLKKKKNKENPIELQNGDVIVVP